VLANRPASDFDATFSSRKETFVDFQAAYVLNDPRWRASIFGGPTYFRLKQDMVNSIRFTQFTSVGNSVLITGAPEQEVTGSTWGLNVGTDASYFPWRYVGAGGGVVYNWGRVHLDKEPFSGVAADVPVSSLTLVVGARFHF
jgi:hypothetical protein